jgi:hypothetical protein
MSRGRALAPATPSARNAQHPVTKGIGPHGEKDERTMTAEQETQAAGERWQILFGRLTKG